MEEGTKHSVKRYDPILRRRATALALICALLLGSFALAPVAKALPASDYLTLKTLVESATTSVTIELDNADYIFTAPITNPTVDVQVTIVGKCLTRLVMDPSAGVDARLIDIPEGSLSMETVIVKGNAGVNGGVSARSLNIDNCQFSDNHNNAAGGALSSYNSGGSGRAIPITVRRSVFENNSSAYDGGAIRVESNYFLDPGGAPGAGAGPVGSPVLIQDCIFDNNRVAAAGGIQYGGAVSIKTSRTAEVRDCLFENNAISGAATSYSGALHMLGVEEPLVTGCVFDNNRSADYGGALSFIDCAPRNSGHNMYSKVEYSTFLRNGARYGGGLYVGNQGGQLLEVQNSTFANNTASAGITGGSGVYNDSLNFTEMFLNSVSLIDNAVGWGAAGAMVNVCNLYLADGMWVVGGAVTNHTGLVLTASSSGDLEPFTMNDLRKNMGAKILSTGLLYGFGGTFDALKSGNVPRGLSQNGQVRKGTPDSGAYELVADVAASYAVNHYQLGTTTPVAPATTGSGSVGEKIWAFDEDTLVPGYHYRVADKLVTTLAAGANVINLYYCPDTIPPGTTPTPTPGGNTPGGGTPTPGQPSPGQSVSPPPEDTHPGWFPAFVVPLHTEQTVHTPSVTRAPALIEKETVTEAGGEVPVTGGLGAAPGLMLSAAACAAALLGLRGRRRRK